MAREGSSTMNLTLGAGSEEDFDVICDPCNSEGQRVQATGHCIDCNVNMCVSCLKYHKKLPVVKDHVTKDKSTLSQSQKARKTVNKQAEKYDPLIDRCPKHPEELIKFYCNSHLTLCCSVCVSLEHRSCKQTDVIYIRDVSDNVVNSDELTTIQADLQMLVARLTSTQSRTKWIKQTMNDSYLQTITDISKLKKEIVDMLEKLENEIRVKALLMKEQNVNALDTTVSACGSAIAEAMDVIADLDQKKNASHKNRLFISMKLAEKRLRDMNNEAQELCDRSKYERFSLKPNGQLTNLLSTLTSLGDILASSHSDVTAKYQHDIKILTELDTTFCDVGGILVLPNGRLALTDYNNMSVKMIDVMQRKVSNQIKLESNPRDLTHTKDGKIAVTLDKKRYLQILSVSPALSMYQTITVNGFYFGIECISNKFFLACINPIHGVHICDMSGVLLQQIATDFVGNPLFTCPLSIAASPGHGVLYITDSSENTVLLLTIEGKPISKYTNERLTTPCGLVVDESGYVYICSRDSSTVHQLSPSGQLIKILPEKEIKMKMPGAIAYNANHMYISSASTKPEWDNSIKVYMLQK